MKGLKFKANKNCERENPLWWEKIYVVDVQLFNKTKFKDTYIYNYILHCVCDGEYVSILQNKLEDCLSYGMYILDDEEQ